MQKATARKGVFYGWFIVAAGFFTMFVSAGARNGFGVFIIPMSDDLHLSRGAISAAIAIGWLVNGLTQPLLGRFYDRLGGRTVISYSLLVLGGTTMLLSLTNNIWMLVFLYGFVMSTAASGASLVTIGAIMSKWFYRKRGAVISITSSGASTGSMILAPFAAYLIIIVGWRITWGVMGAMVLLLALPLAFFLIKDDPAYIGESPDGDAHTSNLSRSSGNRSASPTPLEVKYWRDSYKSAPMWQLSGSYFICGVTTGILAAHYVPFAIDTGASPSTAALAFGLMMGFNTIGVLAAGFYSDKIGRKNLLGIVYATRGLAYAVLLLTPGTISLWGFAVVAGLSWIATVPLTTSLTAEIYGLRNMGTLTGLITFAHQMGSAISILMAGIMFDMFGSYTIPFAIAGSFLVLASLASFSIKEKKYSAKYQTSTVEPATASPGGG